MREEANETEDEVDDEEETQVCTSKVEKRPSDDTGNAAAKLARRQRCASTLPTDWEMPKPSSLDNAVLAFLKL